MRESTFADTLRRYRQQARFSQSRLASYAGFDHSYVSRLESGTRTPTRSAVVALGKAMQLPSVDMDCLVASAGYMPGQVESLLAAEPVIGEAFAVLRDMSVAEDAKDDLRASIALLIRQAQRTASRSVPA